MPKHQQEIVLQKNNSLYWTYLLILLIVSALVSFLWWYCYNQSNVFFWIFLILFSVSIVIYLVDVIISQNSIRYLNSTVNQQFPENLDISNTIHDAFVLIHSGGEKRLFGGLSCLIFKFKSEKYPFKIYHCYNPDEFKTVLANENAKYLWIFGHGWRGGITFKWRVTLHDVLHLKFKKSTIFRYSDLIENGTDIYPSKDYIAQFHCNHISKKDPSNRPLPEFIMQNNLNLNNYHVSDNMNSNISIWFATRKLTKSIKRTPINPDEGSNVD